jgi:hypothetical protein
MSIVLNQIIFSINYNRNFRVVVINISHQMKSNNGGTNIKKIIVLESTTPSCQFIQHKEKVNVAHQHLIHLVDSANSSL